eukprot:m.51497 g.51497  ORF g.51497 m.51497 type:complete len:225 (-) comp9057_c0_seq1:134-808(-)
MDPSEGGPDPKKRPSAPRRSSFGKILSRHKHPRDGKAKTTVTTESGTKENTKSPGKKRLRRRLSLRRTKSLGQSDQNVSEAAAPAEHVNQCEAGPHNNVANLTDPPQAETIVVPEPPQQGVDAEVEAPVLLFGLNVTGMPAEAMEIFRNWVMDLGEENEALKADNEHLNAEKVRLDAQIHQQSVTYAKKLREVKAEVADLKIQNEQLAIANAELREELDCPEDV